MKVLSVFLAVTNRAIAAGKTHISALAFTVIFHIAVWVLTVTVAVHPSADPRYDEYNRFALRRYNPALLLSTKSLMDVATAIIDDPKAEAEWIRRNLTRFVASASH